MSSAPATHRPPSSPTRRRWQLRLLAAVAVALTGGVTAALGGFDEVVPADETIPVAVGEPFNSGPWLVTVESAEIGYNLRGHSSLGEDRTLILQVNARVENIDNRTRGVYGLTPILDLKDGPRLAETSFSDGYAAAYSLRDNARVDYLQPGLPERLAFVWELAPAQVPDEVTVLVNASTRDYDYLRIVGVLWEKPARPGAVAVTVLDRAATT